MSKENKYPCPACGFLVFDYQQEANQVCPLCEINDKNTMNKIIEKSVKGDLRGYMISLIALTLSISILFFLYYKLNPIFMGIWGARSGWYMDEYRTWGGKVWRMLYRATYSWMFLILPLLWMFSAFLLQSVFEKDKAKIFNKGHTALILIISAITIFAFLGLMLMPLIRR